MPPQQDAARQATWDEVIAYEAKRQGIPPALALAVARKESSLNPNAVGDGGKAVGLFQLHDAAAQDTGVDKSDPIQNIQGGIGYLKQLDTRYKGDITKVLHAYNGGMANVDAGTVSPDAQAYAAGILADLSTGMRATTTPPPQAASLPVGATAGMLKPDAATDKAPAKKRTLATPDEIVSDFAGGLRAGAARTVFGGGDLIRRGINAVVPESMQMERVIQRPAVKAGMEVPDSMAGKTGKFVEDAVEFTAMGGAITKVRKAAQLAKGLVAAGLNPASARVAAATVEGAIQAASAGALTKVKGEDGAGVAATVAGLAPVASAVFTNLAPIIKTAALEKMTKVLSAGVKGDITPYLEKNLRTAAGDLIEMPLQRTWSALKDLTRGGREQAGASLTAALDGPLGGVLVPKAPIVSALDELVEKTAKHLTPINGQLAEVTYNPQVVKAVDELKQMLGQYGDDIPAAYLHDIKKTWDAAVFPIREAGHPVASIAEQLTTAQKKARIAGTNAIRQVFRDDVPSLAKLDEATAHAIKLDQFVKNLSRRAPNLSSAKSFAVQATGGAIGATVGGLTGHSIVGAHLGYATARLLQQAMASPAWRMATPVMKTRLADAVLAGKSEVVRKIVTPMVLAGATE